MDRLIAACPNIEELHVGKKKSEVFQWNKMIHESYLVSCPTSASQI